MDEKPKPGSPGAIDAGCTCAVLDNNHGRYAPMKDPETGGDCWWITVGCPVHNPA